MPYLGLLDVSGIQRFLFRSHELKKIAEASEDIEDMSEHENGLFAKMARDAGARLLVAAGGNAALLADSEEKIREAMRRISHHLLEQGDGLQIVVTAPCTYEQGELASIYKNALKELERRKLTQPRSLDFSFAGLDAPRPLHHQQGDTSRNRRRPSLRPSGLSEPTEFKNVICEASETSDLMAVVNVDGIGMGKKLYDWLDNSAKDGDDAKFEREYKQWSQYIKDQWHTAWNATLDEVERRFAPRSHGGIWTLQHPIFPDRAIHLRDSRYHPWRRIYQGGDDLTFVCDARIALSMASFLARQLENPLPDPNLTCVPEAFRQMAVSIGVVFVDSHFPFSRAMQLAEVTRQKAKVRALELDEDDPPSTIDWWLNRQGALTRHKLSFEGASYKPYKLYGHSGVTDVLSWEQLETMLLGDSSQEGMWDTFRLSRGKMKDLLAAAESGEQSGGVRRLLQLRPLEKKGKERKELGFVSLLGSGVDPETGFHNNLTPLLDAGELYDIHFPFREMEDKKD